MGSMIDMKIKEMIQTVEELTFSVPVKHLENKKLMEAAVNTIRALENIEPIMITDDPDTWPEEGMEVLISIDGDTPISCQIQKYEGETIFVTDKYASAIDTEALDYHWIKNNKWDLN